MATDNSVTGPINIGNPGEFTILELAEKVIKFTNTSSKIVYKDLPGDDPQQRRPDITQAKQLLGWEPTFDLDEGLKRTIRYFEGMLRVPDIL
jgi:UDP-glucuronate decarboxylase